MEHFCRTYGLLSLAFLLAVQPLFFDSRLKAAEKDSLTLSKESLKQVKTPDSLTVYLPNPKKAVWYSLLCPGLGQLYNRRYWKLPFVGAGVISIAYAINWNGKYYNAYTHAYRDIMDNDPNTTSYLKLLPPGSRFSESQLSTVLKNRQQKFRRNRDLSYIGAAGIYLLCVMDAFVDAQLYDFDITPDLSLTPVNPGVGSFGNARAIELSLAFRF